MPNTNPGNLIFARNLKSYQIGSNYYYFLFQHYQKLRHHVETVHAKHKPWKCEFCEYRHAKHWGINEHMKNVHKKGGSESESPSGVKRGRPPGTKNFDETKVTHGAGICPHCEKVRFEIEFFLRGRSQTTLTR